MRLREVAHFALAGIEAARRHGLQQRLPEVDARRLHQGHGGLPAPAEAIVEASDKLQTRRTAADHADLVRRLVARAPARARSHLLMTRIRVRVLIAPPRYAFHPPHSG
jgi:hypothetical protein